MAGYPGLLRDLDEHVVDRSNHQEYRKKRKAQALPEPSRHVQAMPEYAALMPAVNASDQSTVTVTVNIHSDMVANHAPGPSSG